jgi:hypothetical protein
MTKVRDENGDFEFDFGGCDVVKLDEQPELQGVASADFAVTPPAEPSLLIEVKDPSTPRARPHQQQVFLLQMTTDAFIEHKLIAACTNSLVYMLKRRPERQQYEFIAVFGMDRMFDFGFDETLLGPLQANLNRKLRQYPGEPRVERATVMTEYKWNEYLPQFPLRRVSNDREDGDG